MSHPNLILVTLLTPDRIMLEDYPATSLTMPGEEGELGIFPQHTPVLLTLKTGLLTIHSETETFCYSISEGFADILPDRVILLVSKAQTFESAKIA